MYKKDVEKLKMYAKAYYDDNEPIVTDTVYDKLYHKVLNYESEHPEEIDSSSPTQFVKESHVEGFKTFKHYSRMWSQQDIFNIEEFKLWKDKKDTEYGKLEYLVEPKYDGLSLKLYYEEGTLVRAVTRGDGETGDDILNNALKVANIPYKLRQPKTIEISGEVYMSSGVFKALNKSRSESGEKLLANPRNAAAGSIRLLDSSEVAKRGLSFVPWKIESLELDKLSDAYNEYILLGFEVLPAYKLFHTVKELDDYYNEFISYRKQESTPLDGIVIKVNDISLHDTMGYTNKFPRHSVALKFPPIEETTVVKDIITQVGRTGRITPVGVLEPTHIDGSIVDRVTLHNFTEIEKKDIRIGDIIVLIKSGDIIPKVSSVLYKNRSSKSKPYVYSNTCPSCNNIVIKRDGNHYCVNRDCVGIICKNIEFFGSKKAMDIKGLGESVVKDLVTIIGVRDPIELYNLTYEKIDSYKIPGYGYKKISKLLQAIEDTKGIDMVKFIISLGIPSVGNTVSKILVSKFKDNWYKVTKDDLLNIPTIGEVIIEEITTYINNNINYIEDMLTIVKPVVNNTNISKYAVITGKFNVSRKKIVKILEDKGIGVRDTVSKNVDMLIVGNNPSSKLDKATKLGIMVTKLSDL